MCGIVGKASADSRVEPALVETMCSLVEHRGPDSRGSFVEDCVGLGMQRLAIIDVADGAQPIYNEDRTVVVVLNGEIYNYVELREELQRRGHRFATHSDTEVIVHLYEDHGAGCVEFLRGMFAFAVWDRRRRRLVLARDRVGKKPLFYSQTRGTIWFASEPRAILADPQVPRDVNFNAIDSFLQLSYVPHPESAFAALRKLPPAHTLTWESGRAEVRRYWKLSHQPRLARRSAAEVGELIRNELLEATRLRLRSDVPLGAFLSGGVDSSAVVAAMVRETSGPVKTFSIGFDEEAFDETRYAREVAQLLHTDHHELHVKPDAMEVLPRLVWHYGEPFADASAIPSFYLAELARAHVTVALNGDGGDESFAGYRRHVAYRVMERLDVIPRDFWKVGAWVSEKVGSGAQVDSARSRASRLLKAMEMDPIHRHRLWMSYLTREELERLYTPEFAQSVDTGLVARTLEGVYMDSDADSDLGRLLDTDVNSYLPDQLLVKMDIATMASSLEVRSPLLDHRLMETVAAIPAAHKTRGHTTKALLKDALRPWLPDRILDRKKTGFGVPLAAWFRGDLRSLPGEVLLDERATARGIFRPEAVAGLIDDHLARRRDNSQRLWSLIQLELWLRTYVDRVTVNEPTSMALVSS